MIALDSGDLSLHGGDNYCGGQRNDNNVCNGATGIVGGLKGFEFQDLKRYDSCYLN